MLGESLNGIPERLLYALVKVKPGLHWRPCDFRGNRAVGYLLWRSVYRESNCVKRDSVLLFKSFDTRCEVIGFEDCSVD